MAVYHLFDSHTCEKPIQIKEEKIKLIDSHTHLDLMDDTEGIIARAKTAGIEAVLTMGTNLASNKKTLELAKIFSGYVYPCLGIHPSNLHEGNLTETLNHIIEYACNSTAIGEIGLDYSYSSANNKKLRLKQQDIYIKLLKIARTFSMPVSIHSRSAYKDSLNLLLDYGPNKAVFHWYDGPLHVLKEILNSDFYISATPATVYNKGLRTALEKTPLDQILLETDSPVFLRNENRMSEPIDLYVTLRALAKLKDVSEDYVAEVIRRNTENLFHLSL
jgi:TatD DNase family protein